MLSSSPGRHSPSLHRSRECVHGPASNPGIVVGDIGEKVRNGDGIEVVVKHLATSDSDRRVVVVQAASEGGASLRAEVHESAACVSGSMLDAEIVNQLIDGPEPGIHSASVRSTPCPLLSDLAPPATRAPTRVRVLGRGARREGRRGRLGRVARGAASPVRPRRSSKASRRVGIRGRDRRDGPRRPASDG